jgi:hypothetical protein
MDNMFESWRESGLFCFLLADLYQDQLSENPKLMSALSRVVALGDLEKDYNVELLSAKGMLETLFAMQETTVSNSSVETGS